MTQPSRKRGFALLSPERMREIAALGGKTAHAAGKAHRFTSEEAAQAGRLSQIARRTKSPRA